MLHDFVQLIHLLLCTFIDLSLSDLYLLTVFTFGPYIGLFRIRAGTFPWCVHYACFCKQMATPMYRFAGGTASQSDQTRVVLIGDSFASRFHRYCRAHGFVNGGLDPLRFSLSVVSRGGPSSA